MKHPSRFLPVVLLACVVCACSPRLHSFWAGNYNIRVYTDYDLGDKHWNNRKDKVFALLRHYDVCGLEEVTDLQAAEFIGAMEAQGYRYIGYGRDNGLLEGEGSIGEQTGLVYRKSRFECSRHGRFFLSTTPEEPSKLDSSAYTRLVVWARLKDLQNGREFYFFATHLDHPITPVGIRTRTRQAAIAIDQIRSIAGDLPFVLSGDLNCEPSEPAYALFATQWKDAFLCADTLVGSGYETVDPQTGAPLYEGLGYTYTGLYNTAHDPYPKRIDYLFCSPGVHVESYQADTAKLGHGTFPSDHLPVRAHLHFEKR